MNNSVILMGYLYFDIDREVMMKVSLSNKASQQS